MTKDEALKLALEVLEYIDLCDNDRDFLHPHECFQLDKAITAIKEALAQPAQEPRNFCPRCGKRTADLTVIHTCTPPEGGHQ